MKSILIKIVLILFLLYFLINPDRVLSYIFSENSRSLVNIIIVPTPTLSPTSTPAPILIPKTLIIPKINVNSSIQALELDGTGIMPISENFNDVSWLSNIVIPGQSGNAILLGHYDTVLGTAAVFYNLNLLEIGDEIEVVNEQSEKLKFVVYKKQSYENNQFPFEEIFKNNQLGKNLILITCDGVWNFQTKNYSHRLIIYTQLSE